MVLEGKLERDRRKDITENHPRLDMEARSNRYSRIANRYFLLNTATAIFLTFYGPHKSTDDPLIPLGVFGFSMGSAMQGFYLGKSRGVREEYNKEDYRKFVAKHEKFRGI